MSLTRTAIIVTGGSALAPGALLDLVPGAYVIAADSGLDHALAGGLIPQLVVGDLDSVSEAGLQWARTHDVEIQESPPDKDFTDTELALACATSWGATDLILLSGGSGLEDDRLDHTIGAITALGAASLATCQSVTARWGHTLVQVLHGPRTVNLPVATDRTFSLLALHGPCLGVSVTGARWPLADATIEAASNRGVSNETLATHLRVQVNAGVLTVIFPNQFGALS